ncbi:MAG: imidazole glycerol phosphate synthase subunit HisH [Flavobacteriales bacterium]|jgi:glutamine amidotransferase|nr:imidazole glycerol phosphate synthase subunit HisH [Flavobacteriales bacterium]
MESNKIVILDIGIGNMNSIRNMIKKIGYQAIISKEIEDIKTATRFILAGVGAFDKGISNLKNQDFFKELEYQVLENKKPILGICLGMQMLTNRSDEGSLPGLGWIDAEVLKFPSKEMQDKNLRIPHMGWNTFGEVEGSNPLFKDIQTDFRYYYVHSFYVHVKNRQNSLAKTKYGITFDSSIHKENVFGVQFHPEKSHKYGFQLLKNYCEL